MSLLSTIVGWLRAGYPAGVPEQDFVPLLALLGRRLTDEEVDEVSRALRSEGLVPAGRVDVGVGITRVTDELPAEDEIQRVMRRLEAIGYPVLDADFDRATDNIVEVPGGFVVARVRRELKLAEQAVVDLYASVGWTTYSSDPHTLMKALKGSHRVVAAWDRDGRLVGLARSVSDKTTICYVQDLLVHPDVRRRGIGSALLERLLRDYPHVRQTVLMTDTDGGPHELYRALGFTPMGEHVPGLTGYVRLRRGVSDGVARGR